MFSYPLVFDPVVVKGIQQRTLLDLDRSKPLQKYPIDATFRRFMTAYFNKFRLPTIEYAMVFCWGQDKGSRIHVDGNFFLRKAALNIICEGGEGAEFSWFDSPKPAEWGKCDNLPALYIDENLATLKHKDIVHPVSFVQTDIPHRVRVKEPTVLLTLRFDNNPTYQSLIDTYLANKTNASKQSC